MVLSNRLQSKMSLFLVSPRSFYSEQWTPFILLYDEEDPVYWVEVSCFPFRFFSLPALLLYIGNSVMHVTS